MTQTTKLVCATRQGYDKELKEHREKGWQVKREGTIARPRNRTTYIAYLER